MSLKRVALMIVLTALATAAIAQNPPPASASYADDGRKAEPNSQAPAVPQANNGANLNQPDPAANAALQGRIQQALQSEPSLSASHVSVSVTDNAIELSGTAASSKDKETAERIAQSFDGNRKFNDKLTVTGQAPGVNNAGTNNPQR
jgi:BON domain